MRSFRRALPGRSLRVLSVLALAALAACAQSVVDGSEEADRDPTIPALDPGKGGALPADPGPTGGGDASTSTATDSGGGGKQDTGAPPVDASVDAGPPDTGPPAAPRPTQGEVLISEVMYDTTGAEPDGEWIELHNTASSARSLNALTLKDAAGRTHKIPASPAVTVGPGEYKVLVRSRTGATTAKVPAAAVLYEYGAGLPSNAGILLANGATGGVSLLDGSTEIARAPYGGWWSQSGGSSVQLKTMTYAASGAQTGWCLSFNTWATGSDKGTPGAAGDCP